MIISAVSVFMMALEGSGCFVDGTVYYSGLQRLRPGILFSQFKSVANLLGRDTFMFRSLSFSRDASPSGPPRLPRSINLKAASSRW